MTTLSSLAEVSGVALAQGIYSPSVSLFRWSFIVWYLYFIINAEFPHIWLGNFPLPKSLYSKPNPVAQQ